MEVVIDRLLVNKEGKNKNLLLKLYINLELQNPTT